MNASNHVPLLSEDATIRDIEAFRISGVSLTTIQHTGKHPKTASPPKRLIDFLWCRLFTSLFIQFQMTFYLLVPYRWIWIGCHHFFLAGSHRCLWSDASLAGMSQHSRRRFRGWRSWIKSVADQTAPRTCPSRVPNSKIGGDFQRIIGTAPPRETAWLIYWCVPLIFTLGPGWRRAPEAVCNW